MAYVVTENCIKCKYTTCVEVCPVDCFHEGENMLVINPDNCIDCGVCQLECDANAIFPESENLLKWIEINKEYSQKWTKITITKKPMPRAAEFNGVDGKFDKYFHENNNVANDN